MLYEDSIVCKFLPFIFTRKIIEILLFIADFFWTLEIRHRPIKWRDNISNILSSSFNRFQKENIN